MRKALLWASEQGEGAGFEPAGSGVRRQTATSPRSAMKSQDGSPRASAASRLRAGQPVSSRAPCVHAGPHGASRRRFEAATELQSAALRLRSATALAAKPLATRFLESPECRFSAPQPAAGGLRPAPRASPSLTACKALACLHAVLQCSSLQLPRARLCCRLNECPE